MSTTVESGARIAGERSVTADACVIGTGAGGAPVAALLAEAGMRVAILEEGSLHEPASMTARPRDMMARLYRDGGQIATVGDPPIVLPLGRGIGGTTLVNSGTCFRTPQRVLDRWRADHGLDLDLAAEFELVEEAIGVREVPPELAGRNANLVKDGADLLGVSAGYLQRNARGCIGSGVCAFGCPTGAKQHAGQVWIPRAAAGRGDDVHRTRARGGSSSKAAACARCSPRTDGGGSVARSLRDRDRRRRCAAHPAAAAPQRLGDGVRATSAATSRSIPPARRAPSTTRSSTHGRACRRASTSTSSPPTGSCSRGSRGRPTRAR